MLSIVKVALFAYAAFMAVGGFLGYQEKGSVISLIAGFACAILAVVAGTMLPGKAKIGLIIGIVTAVAAGVRPLGALMKGSLKPWPGGAILGTSVVILVICIAALVSAGKESV